MICVFVHAVSPWRNRNSGKLQISEHIQLYGQCSGICSLQEFSIQIACTACTKSYYFPLAIDCALSFQNVTIPRVTSYFGLDHVCRCWAINSIIINEGKKKEKKLRNWFSFNSPTTIIKQTAVVNTTIQYKIDAFLIITYGRYTAWSSWQGLCPDSSSRKKEEKST
jgi:hypothetical protein